MRIPLPIDGLNDALAFSDQPSTTSRDLSCVFSVDPITNRVRPAQSSGTSKYCPTRIANAPVQYMGQITYDSRKMTYSANAGTTETSWLNPSAQAARIVVRTADGAIISTDGNASVVKTNDNGTVAWVWKAPIKDPASIIRSLHVDADGHIFVGVSEGGVQTKSRFWRVDEQKSGPPKQVWQFPPDPETSLQPGAFVEKVIVRGDLIYTAQNFADRWGAFMVVYRGALSTGLTEAWRREVAYPVSDFALKADGSVVGCSRPFATRGLDPRFPGFTQKTIDWTLDDLPDIAQRRWVDLDASKLKAFYDRGKEPTDPTQLQQDDAVPDLPDFGDSGRDFATAEYALHPASYNDALATDPIYAEHGIGAKPAIHFRGQQVGPPLFGDAYQGGYSYSVANSASDQHRGIVPGYAGCKWVMFLVFRPEEDRTTPSADKRRGVWGQNLVTGDTGHPALGVYVNRDSSGNFAAGVGSFADVVVPATGAAVGGAAGNTFPMHFYYGETTPHPNWKPNDCGGAGVLTILWDGGDTATGDPLAHSLLRWNGKPIDRWESQGRTLAGAAGTFIGTTDPANIGTTVNAFVNDLMSFRGYIARVIVLRDFAGASEGIIEHPHYPWDIHAAGVQPTPTPWAATDTEMEKIEGMLGHEYGISHLFDTGTASPPDFGGAPVAPWTPVDPGNWPHPYYLWNGPPRKDATASRSEAFQMHNPEGLVWKLDGAKGDIKWVCAPGSNVMLGGGMGTSVAVDSDGNIGSLGRAIQSDVTGAMFNYESSFYNVRKIVDLNGTGPSGFDASNTTGSSSWARELSIAAVAPPPYINPFVEHARIAFDDQDNLYVPIDSSDADPTDQYTLKVFAKWPSATPTLPPHGSNPGDPWQTSIQQPELLAQYLSNAGDVGQCVAVAPSPVYRFGPTYDWDRAPSTIARTARTEFVFLGVSQPTPAQTESHYKVRMTTATAVTGPPRTTLRFMVVNGFVKKFDTSGITDFAGAGTINQSVVGALDATAEYIDGFEAFGQFFLTDGKNYFVIDPVNDLIRLWKATDSGKLPERRKLMVNWRGRATLARGVDEPSHWEMSELGKPFSWNFKTVPANLPTRAFKGEASRIGLCPDIVNGLIAYSDNQLIALGDRSVWALTGDPADEGQAAGWRQMSDSTGGAFGRAWCKDPEGNVFFFGSRGGVYFMPPNLSLVSLSPAPKSMTENTIEERLSNVNLATYRVELAWNTAIDGLHVFLIPFTNADAPIHFVWLSRTKSWHERPFGFTVSAVLNIDGDDVNDRRLLIAGSDGYVRVWDTAAKNDDGVALETRMLIGPIRPPKTDNKREFRFRNLVVEMAAEQDGALVNIYGSNRPDDKGTVRWSGAINPGRFIIPVTIAAGYVWVEVKQAHANRRWAIESMEWEQVVPAGRMLIGT